MTSRPDWINVGAWLSTSTPPRIRITRPLFMVVEADRSPDEVRRATCQALLDAKINASVELSSEWLVYSYA